MAQEFSSCPSCGTNCSNDRNNHRIPVRECSDCSKIHCGECSKHLDTYRCTRCNSNKIKLIGFVHNKNFNT